MAVRVRNALLANFCRTLNRNATLFVLSPKSPPSSGFCDGHRNQQSRIANLQKWRKRMSMYPRFNCHGTNSENYCSVTFENLGAM